MRSHELAQLLLARRDNDVRIRVIVETTEDAYASRSVRLCCDDDLLDADVRAAPVVGYDSGADMVVINAGGLIVNDPEDDE